MAVTVQPTPAAAGPEFWRHALEEDPYRSLTTLPGWRRFTTTDTGPPVLLTEKQRESLPSNDRNDYDDARLDYHLRLGIVATTALRQVINSGRRLTLLNRHAVSARRGLILSGPAGTGKTTALTQLGKTQQTIDQARHPGLGDRIPVIYITVPPAATPRMVVAEFARFLGLPFTSRANITDIIEAVCGVAVDTRVGVVLCDEIYNLSLSTRNGAEVSDTLKYVSERIPATFVFAGINVEREGLFSGTRGQQIAGRFGLITTEPFPYQQEWQALIATLEQSLRLHHHPQGTLASLDRYLHQRTGGMIGSLSHLIRAAAIEAILDGTEKISRTTLEQIELDHAAESGQRKRRSA